MMEIHCCSRLLSTGIFDEESTSDARRTFYDPRLADMKMVDEKINNCHGRERERERERDYSY